MTALGSLQDLDAKGSRRGVAGFDAIHQVLGRSLRIVGERCGKPTVRFRPHLDPLIHDLAVDAGVHEPTDSPSRSRPTWAVTTTDRP